MLKKMYKCIYDQELRQFTFVKVLNSCIAAVDDYQREVDKVPSRVVMNKTRDRTQMQDSKQGVFQKS